MNKHRWLTCLGVTTLVTSLFAASTLTPAGAQGDSRTFPETGKTIKGLFLNYWNANGALPQQGYPITDEFKAPSQTDGKTYTMQCFERSVFENHPENVGKPSEVLLSLLGNFYFKQRYQFGDPTNQKASTINPRTFPETGHTIGGKFRDYWEANGGLTQQGFPITEEFPEKSDLDGKTYMVQYFERAVFELHPENAGTQYEVLLSQLGKFLCPANKPAPTSTPGANPSPTPNPSFDPNKYYHLTTQFRGDSMCLDTADNTATSSFAALHSCSNVTGESWRITSWGDGTWKLTTEFLGANKCLDGGDFAQVVNCNGATGQHWIIKPVASQPGYYTVTNAFVGSNKCLDIVNGGPKNNYAQFSNCASSTGQNWKFTLFK